VTTAKLADASVTSGKLSVIKALTAGTVPANGSTKVPSITVPQNSIVNVIPTSPGEISWNFTVSLGAAAGQLVYNITVTNFSAAVVSFAVREIAFN
jgi:hypothetical protein